MQNIERYDDHNPVRSTSLPSVIARVHQDMLGLKLQLEQAHGEIERLRRQLTDRRLEPWPELDIELRPLRRQVAFHCHPDRGGDDGLLRRLNALFDMLERFATETR